MRKGYAAALISTVAAAAAIAVIFSGYAFNAAGPAPHFAFPSGSRASAALGVNTSTSAVISVSPTTPAEQWMAGRIVFYNSTSFVLEAVEYSFNSTSSASSAYQGINTSLAEQLSLRYELSSSLTVHNGSATTTFYVIRAGSTGQGFITYTSICTLGQYTLRVLSLGEGNFSYSSFRTFTSDIVSSME